MAVKKMQLVVNDISKQDEIGINRQNFWVSQGLWVPVGFMTEDDVQYFELHDQGVPVSVVSYILNRETRNIYSSVFTLPTQRKKGYAKILYDKTLSRYKTSGVWAFVENDNEPSVILHMSLGFEVKKINDFGKTNMFWSGK